jgi:hypothetical protein
VNDDDKLTYPTDQVVGVLDDPATLDGLLGDLRDAGATRIARRCCAVPATPTSPLTRRRAVR